MKVYDLLSEVSIFDEWALKKTTWQNPEQLADWLESNGFKELPRGSYSTAFVKEGYNRIVKISERQDNCWLRFAKLTLDSHNNPYLPQIPWIKTYKTTHTKTPENFFVTVVERLDPLDLRAINRLDDPIVLATIYASEYISFEGMERLPILRRLKKLAHLKTKEEAIKLASHNPKHLFPRTLRKLSGLSGRFCFMDIHSDNMMYRTSSNTPVITDPTAPEGLRTSEMP